MAEIVKPPFNPLVAPVDSSDWGVRPVFELRYLVVPCRGGVTNEDFAFVMGITPDEPREVSRREGGL